MHWSSIYVKLNYVLNLTHLAVYWQDPLLYRNNLLIYFKDIGSTHGVLHNYYDYEGLHGST